jgi:hypothetical protein
VAERDHAHGTGRMNELSGVHSHVDEQFTVFPHALQALQVLEHSFWEPQSTGMAQHVPPQGPDAQKYWPLALVQCVVSSTAIEHWQAPPRHASLFAQTLPHAPQLFLSVERFLHAPLHED